ncbi:hypothetical protein [Mycolicibacterium grossiae]|uniref:Uncharacterized protein n=1 Tax=Mycolicibacterium grossiae TaxID=1552759 RepID=A0A1E8PWS5_9MYCO|nr:hypothetical protein [Mycolicibacterium grossiae]OFJ50715.1 hypothetical protein BEL07_26625 [Mycolicibacterium grossiae]QEM44448.1 hypothetical protein FZ046_06295 [Mycolicibacterium grossiae]
MKKFGFTTLVAGGLAAAVLGLAGPAQADAISVVQTVPAGIDHHYWLDDTQQQANTPHVDTTVHQSR